MANGIVHATMRNETLQLSQPAARSSPTETPVAPASYAGRMRDCRLTLCGGNLVSFNLAFNCRSVDRTCAKAAVHTCTVVALFVFVALLRWLWCATVDAALRLATLEPVVISGVVFNRPGRAQALPMFI